MAEALTPHARVIPCYQLIASLLSARTTCRARGNSEWFDIHSESLQIIARDILPSGSGIDCGTKIDMDKSHSERIVLIVSFHHMNDGGMYDGWTEHAIIVTPSLVSKFEIRITGRDRNGIKEYLGDTYYQALSDDVKEAWDPATDTRMFTLARWTEHKTQ